MQFLAELSLRLKTSALFAESADGDAGAAIHPWSGEPDPCKLTQRHRQVLHLLKTGLSEKEVARALRISPHTVHVYVKAIYKKLKVTSRGELLCLCLNHRVFNDVHGALRLARVDH
jgi:DNA-binding NarL/FixJ family response regulator